MQDKRRNSKLLRKRKTSTNSEIFSNGNEVEASKSSQPQRQGQNSTKKIFGLIRDAPELTEVVKSKEVNKLQPPKLMKKRKRDGNFNTGRWQPEEHRRFIEALLKYGNEWRSVQRHVGTRSSTQARSHAQKFFAKIGKTQIGKLDIDITCNSFKGLNRLAHQLDNEQIMRIIQTLNPVSVKKSKKKKGSSRGSEVLTNTTLQTIGDISQFTKYKNI
jgi:SHAQKYF class myb-like DNA-binding protein